MKTALVVAKIKPCRRIVFLRNSFETATRTVAKVDPYFYGQIRFNAAIRNATEAHPRDTAVDRPDICYIDIRIIRMRTRLSPFVAARSPCHIRAHFVSRTLYSQKYKHRPVLCRPVFRHPCSFIPSSRVRSRPSSPCFPRSRFPPSGRASPQYPLQSTGRPLPPARRSSPFPAAQPPAHTIPSPQGPQSPH